MMPLNEYAPGRCSGTGARVVQETHFKPGKRTEAPQRAQRLPAYGRELRDAIQAGYRPRWLGGGIVVTSDWNYARAARGARLVCMPDEPAAAYDFTFLRGCDVLVLVPEADELHGEALRAAIRDAGASTVVLAVNREGES